MSDDLIVQSLKRAIQKMKEEPPGTIFTRLQEIGIIDAEGRVLKRAPELPEQIGANGKKAKSSRPRKRKPRRRSAS